MATVPWLEKELARRGMAQDRIRLIENNIEKAKLTPSPKTRKPAKDTDQLIFDITRGLDRAVDPIYLRPLRKEHLLVHSVSFAEASLALLEHEGQGYQACGMIWNDKCSQIMFKRNVASTVKTHSHRLLIVEQWESVASVCNSWAKEGYSPADISSDGQQYYLIMSRGLHSPQVEMEHQFKSFNRLSEVLEDILQEQKGGWQVLGIHQQKDYLLIYQKPHGKCYQRYAHHFRSAFTDTLMILTPDLETAGYEMCCLWNNKTRFETIFSRPLYTADEQRRELGEQGNVRVLSRGTYPENVEEE